MRTVAGRPVPSTAERLVGVWDTRRVPVSLGGLLILVAELHAQRPAAADVVGDICVVDPTGGVQTALGVPRRGVCRVPRSVAAPAPRLDAVLSIEGVHACYTCPEIGDLVEFLASESRPYGTWPSLGEGALDRHVYSSTRWLQDIYRQRGFIPHLACKPEARRWAHRFVEEYVAPDLPVVVHLKNNPAAPGASNATTKAWLAFFEACRGRYDVRFLLIGDDELDGRVRALPNVLATRDRGATLAKDLALMQHAFAFMGMASGPCNMAIFSQTPYVIYKHPNHHSDEMRAELGDADHFPFGTPLQRFVRAFETPEDLLARFAAIYAHADPAAWVRRLAAPR